MYDFEYVDRQEWLPVREELLEIIHRLQDEVREYFTFQYRFVGSSSRNMITRNRSGNQGYDFDVDIEINDPGDPFTPTNIREILRKGLDRITNPHGLPTYRYDYAENSTRVLTIKVKDHQHSCIRHSCDFGIFRKDANGRRQYIRKNSNHGNYTWEYQSEDFRQLPNKIDWIKKHGLWQQVRELYLHKKRTNIDYRKHSRSLFAETVHEIWQKYR